VISFASSKKVFHAAARRRNTRVETRCAAAPRREKTH
jgi:hypothetical protein